MQKFEFIVDCKLEHVNIIQDYIKNEISENFTIITDSHSLKDQFNKNGFHVETIFDNIPLSGIKEEKIFKKVSDHIESLRETFSDIRDENVEIFLGFQTEIHDNLLMLEKFHSILRSKSHLSIIFCLSAYNYYYLACIGIASLLGYKISLPLIIKDKNIIAMDPLSIVEHRQIYETLYHNRIHTNKNDSENNKLIQKESYGIRKTFFQILKSKIIPEYKEFTETPVSFNHNIKSKISEKIFKFQGIKRPCILILHTNDIDLYLKPVYPLLEEFQKNGYPCLILAHGTMTKNELSKRKIEFLDYEPFLDDFDYNHETVKNVLKAIKVIASQNNSVVSIFCQYMLNDKFFCELINNSKRIKFSSLLISKVNPISIFVMPDGVSDQILICDVAKKHKIKTVTTLANLIAPTSNSVGFMAADIITTYGEDCNVSLTKMGYDEKRLIMTGNPRYDNVKTLDVNMIKASLTKKNDINFDRPIILIATSGHDKNEVDWMLDTISYANKKNYEIMIKFHPIFEAERSQALLEKAKGMRFHLMQRDRDVLELLSVTDVLVTDNSSVGMSAILFDKQVIVTNLLDQPYPNNRYDEYGIALLATSTRELESCIDKTISDEHTQRQLAEYRKKYQYWYNYKNDGKAAARIFEILTSDDFRRNMN